MNEVIDRLIAVFSSEFIFNILWICSCDLKVKLDDGMIGRCSEILRFLLSGSMPC